MLRLEGQREHLARQTRLGHCGAVLYPLLVNLSEFLTEAKFFASAKQFLVTKLSMPLLLLALDFQGILLVDPLAALLLSHFLLCEAPAWRLELLQLGGIEVVRAFSLGEQLGASLCDFFLLLYEEQAHNIGDRVAQIV